MRSVFVLNHKPSGCSRACDEMSGQASVEIRLNVLLLELFFSCAGPQKARVRCLCLHVRDTCGASTSLSLSVLCPLVKNWFFTRAAGTYTRCMAGYTSTRTPPPSTHTAAPIVVFAFGVDCAASGLLRVRLNLTRLRSTTHTGNLCRENMRRDFSVP